LNGSGVFGAVEELTESGLGAFEDFFGNFQGAGGSDFPHDALVQEDIAVLAEPHGFDTHALGCDTRVNRPAVADFNAFLGVSTVVDVREVFACDFETFGVDAKGAAAVLE
jgi:hypothetical protein